MVCSVCGRIYSASVYNRPGNRSHCPECLAKLRSNMNTKAANVQSDAARAKAFSVKSLVGKSNIHKALAAISSSPNTAINSHSNVHSKVWFLISPRGDTIETQNIRAFVREHPEYFPNESAAIKSFYILSSSLRRPDTVRRPQYSYLGWRLASEPKTPPDVADRKQYSEFKELRRAKKREQNPVNPIASARIASGLTQAKLAELLGITQSAIAQWESGLRHPKLETLIRIANILHVPWQSLL